MKPGRLVFVFSVLVMVFSGLGIGSPVQKAGAAAAQIGDPVFVGAGDITNCGREEDDATAKLLDSIDGTVFTLGDNAYPDGTAAQFNDCYGPTWGRYKARTMPAVGNHEYHTTGAAGYYGYFGTAASPLDNGCTSDCKGYYSYDLGAWHIIVLNSEMDVSSGSPQEQWLRTDLEANPSACTLAYWHEPRFNSGKHGNAESVGPLWEALYEHGADVVLNGHDHNYQRFAPQNPDGQADPKGIREFIVGTGGGNLYQFVSSQPNTEVRDSNTFGVLKLTLHPTSYDWEFIPIAGQTFTDSGSANCVTGDALTVTSQPPTVIPSPTGTPAQATVSEPIATAVPTITPMPAAAPAPVAVPDLSPFQKFIAWLSRLFGGGK